MDEHSVGAWNSFKDDIGMNLVESIDFMSSILSCKSSEALQKSLSAASKRLGFETFVAGVQLVQPDGSLAHHLVSGYPEKWQAIYAQQGYIWKDPTVAHCQMSTEPLVWTEKTFMEGDAMPMLEEAKSFGLSHGVSAAIHESKGATKSMISLVRDQALGEPAAGIAAAAQVLASCTHFVVINIARDALNPIPAEPVRLTPQELACLRWVSQGKTAWEVGRILSISEPTVVFHLKNVMRKLDASNRPQALAIAIRMGLIN